jgi:glycerol-3-phosphate dehydrogenase
MTETVTTDIAIFGGGIAGLWVLHRLRQTGLSALLFESGTLGGGQTNKAQGIIHGGMKYALQGKLTNEVHAMADMPTVWRECLSGQGELNLSAVPILSQKQYLWSPNKFASKITGFLASAALSSKVETVAKTNYPNVFQHEKFKGDVFSLDEIVIDVPLLIRELAKADQASVYKIEPLGDEGFQFDAQGNLQSVTIYQAGKAVRVVAQQFIFTAGAGNEMIIKHFKPNQVAMQLRPLHMVMVKLPFDLPLYAHCLGLGPRPRLTVTTHYRQDGSAVWYLGGAIAEEGVERDSAAQIKATRDELQTLFPWLDFSEAEFATFMIDRAEPLQKSGLKPDTSFFKSIQNMIVAWPTKLALAPKLAAEIIAHLQTNAITPQISDCRALRIWPMPTVAQPVWEDSFCK